MVVKYIAVDGTIFNTEKDCMKYEKQLNEGDTFTIEYITGNNTKEVYTGKKFDLECLVERIYAFKIASGREAWNEFVNNNFGNFIDSMYDNYDVPLIGKNDTNKWLGYTVGGDIKDFEIVVNREKEYLKKLEKIKKVLD